MTWANRGWSGSARRQLLALPLLLCGALACAEELPLPPREVSYQLNEEPLPAFLERFFQDQGLPVVLSPAVRAHTGTLNGPRSGSAASVFRSIARSNQLAAYYDGNAVYVYRANELGSRSFGVPPSRVRDFERAAAQIVDRDNSYRIVADTGLVMAAGTPRFLERIAGLAASINQQGVEAKTVFHFMPLRYAWASDSTINVGNRRIRVPGVATILRQLVYGEEQGLAAAGNEVLRPSARRLRGQGLAALGDPRISSLARAFGNAQPQGLDFDNDIESVAYAGSSQPGITRIVADPYRNAVVVRDLPERIPMYDSLVAALDVEPQIVEIAATIIDVDTSRMRELGIDWRFSDGNTEVIFGREGTKSDLGAAQLADDVDVLGQIPGFQIGTIIGDAQRFVARINMLVEQGAMNVVSRPQVITMNDIEAVIENSRQVYVPVEGAFEVDLFNVFAGTVLRVTPHLIDEGSRTRIRLLITIEDGDVELADSGSASGGDVPVVTRSAVTTQALIESGQSVLLGGLVRDAAVKQTQKVPLLGDIPLLGMAFRNELRRTERLERLFLISPRLKVANRIAGQLTPSRLDVDIGTVDEIHNPPSVEPLEWFDEYERERERERLEAAQGSDAAAASSEQPRQSDAQGDTDVQGDTQESTP